MSIKVNGKEYFLDMVPVPDCNCGDEVNVKSYGAFGDGVTDDTDAIRRARDEAVARKNPLYFPAGTYMVHGSIELWSDCEIYGEGSKTVIKKIPTITEVLKPKGKKGSFVTGQSTFSVADGSKYTVGYDCFIGVVWQNHEIGLYGKIESIDGNNITVKAYPKHLKGDGSIATGLESLSPMNESYVETVMNTTFPVFCTHKYNADGRLNAVHDVYIHDITIDGSRQDGESSVYLVSGIHFDSTGSTSKANDERVADTPHENIRLENLNLYNSPSDGISVQSCKNVCITNCITKNCGFNGVHVGVGSAIVSVIGCKLNADFCGYFDCAGVSSLSLSNNHFERCLYGIGGLDKHTRGCTIAGNTFRDCGVGVIAGGTPYPQNMVNDAPDTHISMGAGRTITICNNTFYGSGLTGVGISFKRARYITVTGNTFRELATAIETGSTLLARIADNVIKDCGTVLSMTVGAIATIPLTHNSAFVGNVIHADIAGSSAVVSITNAENMLVTGNIITGAGAALNVDDGTTTGVIVENNIVTE